MKLELDKAWYEKKTAEEADLEVTAAAPLGIQAMDEPECIDERREDEFAELHAFGSLVRMLRRDRGLAVEQLAAAARIDPLEIISIERDPKYPPKPRTVHQLADYFKLPDRALVKLSNATTTHNSKLTDAAVRFAANSEKVKELSREERRALAEFVKFLSSEAVG